MGEHTIGQTNELSPNYTTLKRIFGIQCNYVIEGNGFPTQPSYWDSIGLRIEWLFKIEV